MDINLGHIPLGLRERVAANLTERLKNGEFQFNMDNDWDLHLFTLVLKQNGKTMDEVREILSNLPLIGIPKNKRESYIEDILNSLVVGYSEHPLPVYVGHTEYAARYDEAAYGK